MQLRNIYGPSHNIEIIAEEKAVIFHDNSQR